MSTLAAVARTAGEKAQTRAALALAILLVCGPEWTAFEPPGLPDAGGTSGLKIPLLLLALILVAPRRNESVARPSRALTLLGICIAVGLVGALAGPYPISSLLRSGRALLYLLVIWWMAPRLRLRDFLRIFVSFACIVAALALIGQLVGASTSSHELLGGWIPPLHPNGLATVVAMALVVCFGVWCRGSAEARYCGVLSLLLLGCLLMTGSRTSAAAVAAALLIMGLTRQLRGRAIPVVWLIFLILSTNALLHDPLRITSPFERAGKSQIDATFSGRSLAWARASELHSGPIQVFFGEGQGVHRVNLNLRFTKVQTIDGAWPAAYLQTGLVGVVALLAALVLLAADSLRRRNDSPEVFGLVVFLALSTVLESTVNEVTIPFVVFAVLCAASRAANSGSNSRAVLWARGARSGGKC